MLPASMDMKMWSEPEAAAASRMPSALDATLFQLRTPGGELADGHCAIFEADGAGGSTQHHMLPDEDDR